MTSIMRRSFNLSRASGATKKRARHSFDISRAVKQLRRCNATFVARLIHASLVGYGHSFDSGMMVHHRFASWAGQSTCARRTD
jgi:hypothetical protein